MNRALAFLSLLLVATGCGGGEEKKPAQSTKAASEEAAPAEAEAAAKPAAKPWDPAMGTATIKGTVSFPGPAPKRRRVDMGSDPECGAMHGDGMLDESAIVGADGALANVFVSVSKGLDAWTFAPPSEPAMVHQKGCAYTPHVIGMQAGQELVISNDDPVTHNVHSFAKKNASFNQSQQPGGSPISKTLDRSEQGYTLKCDIHGWMSSYVNVVDHPFFDVTGEDGAFEIAGLPPGEYTITALHEVFGREKARVSVGANRTETVEITFAQE